MRKPQLKDMVFLREVFYPFGVYCVVIPYHRAAMIRFQINRNRRMENIRRLVLYFALALVGVMLWNAWLKDYPSQPVKDVDQTQQQDQQQKDTSAFTPPTYNSIAPTTPKKLAIHPETVTNGKIITVQTDVLDVGISTWGGTIAVAKLLKYPVTLKSPHIPIQILSNNPNRLYVAQSGLTNSSTSGGTKVIHYVAEKGNYVLSQGKNTLIVKLSGKAENGLEVTKTFIFKRNHYSVDVLYKIKNASTKTWVGSVYYQLTRRNIPIETTFHSRSYNGAAISSAQEPYEKLTYKKLNESNVSRNIVGGWIAMQQQYFLSAWIPNQNITYHYYSHVSGPSDTGVKNKIFTLGYVGEEIKLAPSTIGKSASIFYVGPEIGDRLSKIANGLDLTIDYGWLWPISKLLFWIMAEIEKIVGNWGWSIVLVTLLIKIVFYPLSTKSYKSMAKMRELQPRLQAIKERYGDDKQALSKATMELYKKEKVSPLGGCLPMLIQIPVFIALYYVLIESVELRQTPFIFWIKDLSVKDPYYILPILMGLSMLAQQKLSPPPPDPTQAKMMMLLPIVFTVFFLTFPSGLVLYWFTNNVLSIVQQWYIMRSYKPETVKSKKKKRKR